MHTPGPWTVEHDKKDKCYRVFSEDGDNGQFCLAEISESQLQAEGNACLIGAAPDLLAFAKLFLKESQATRGNVTGLWAVLRGLEAQALVALAAAEGRTP